MAVEHIFVYGTLMTGMSNHYLIEKYARNITMGLIRGSLYHLEEGYPALVDGASEVRGEIVAIDNMQCALPVLDELEGYLGPGNPDNLYKRVIRQALGVDGKPVVVFVYIWAQPEHLSVIGQYVTGGCWRSFQK